jgi:hypothetical protein
MGWPSRAWMVPTPDAGVQAMSLTAITELPERNLSFHVRRHLQVLPEDPTDCDRQEPAPPRAFPETTLSELFRDTIDAKAHQEAVEDCQTYQRLEAHRYVDALHARYSHLRRYLPASYTLLFAGELGTTALQTGLQLVTQLDTGTLKTLPEKAPTAFVPAAWWPALRQPDGTLDRRTWELALPLGVRDALRAGSLYLPASRCHVSFWKLVYEDTRWAQERDHAYGELAIPHETDQALGQLRHTFDTVARQAATTFPNNPSDKGSGHEVGDGPLPSDWTPDSWVRRSRGFLAGYVDCEPLRSTMS